MDTNEEQQLRELFEIQGQARSPYSLQDVIDLVNKIVKNHETRERLEIMENKLD